MRDDIGDVFRCALANEGAGKFAFPSRGKTGIIYVPADVVRDSTFPLKENDAVLIRIDGERLIVEKSKKR